MVNDAWTPRATNYKISSSISNDITRVSELINLPTRTWKVEVVNSTFSEIDTGRILRVPLAMVEHEDMLVWRSEPSGDFSMRSGYKLLLKNNYNPTAIDLQ